MPIAETFNFFNARQIAADARAKGICIECEKAPVLRTEIEQAEYKISAVCGPCWDALFPPSDDEE